jgi:hypothetical protein
VSDPEAGAARAWLARAVGERGGEVLAPWPGDPDALLAQARIEGVVTLVAGRLMQAGAASPARPALRPLFAAAAREEAITFMMLSAEARRLVGLAQAEGLPVLLLKGSALAHWLYAEPTQRSCGDVDLLLPSRALAEQLAHRLAADGYQRARTSGALVAYELMCTRSVAPGWTLELDIHWGLVNSPLFAQRLSFDELMAEAVPLPGLGPGARGLGAVHALLHACMHRAINLANREGDHLKWLYDLVLLAERLDAAQWQRLQSLAQQRGLAGLVVNGLQAAADVFGRPLAAAPLAALRQAAAHETLDAGRLSDWAYMQQQAYRALPSAGLRLRWLWQRLFPSQDYMRALYGDRTSYTALLGERLRRVLAKLARR